MTSPQLEAFWGGLPRPAPQRHLLRTPNTANPKDFQSSAPRTEATRCMDFSFCPATLPASAVSLLRNGPLWACYHSTFAVLMTPSEPSLGRGCADPWLDQAGAARLCSWWAALAPPWAGQGSTEQAPLLQVRGSSSRGTFWANPASAGSAPAPSLTGPVQGARLTVPASPQPWGRNGPIQKREISWKPQLV